MKIRFIAYSKLKRKPYKHFEKSKTINARISMDADWIERIQEVFMDKNNPANKQSEQEEESVEHGKFNSITNSKKSENQNQEHNTKKVALGPNTKR